MRNEKSPSDKKCQINRTQTRSAKYTMTLGRDNDEERFSIYARYSLGETDRVPESVFQPVPLPCLTGLVYEEIVVSTLHLNLGKTVC
jgi:hypothetical protein